MQQRSPLQTAHSDLDTRLLVLVFAHAMVIHAIQAIVRVTTSYRAVELGLSELWLGVIAAVFALIPTFLAVSVGRYVDRGNDAHAAWIGTWLVFASCIGFRLSDASAWHLLAFTALMGVGHLFLMVSHQMLSMRAASDASREAVFGTYMVANAFGQGLGPMIVGWIGGAARLPPTRLLFGIAMLMTVAALVIAWLIQPADRPHDHTAQAEITPLPQLLRTPGMPTLMLASVITVTAQDLVVIYLPLLGTERGIDVASIGWLLMLRAACAVLARIFYAPIIRIVGRVPLTVLTMLGSSLAYVLIALPLPRDVLYPAMIMIGFGLGIAATLSISNVIDLVPSSARGIALSLRITGNRIGQMLLPLLAGGVAAAAGVAGIFYMVALSLAASGASVHVVRTAKVVQTVKTEQS